MLAPIVVDDAGVAYLAGTGIKVIELVRVWQARKHTPEQLHGDFPQLTLAQVYAALGYYHEHKTELDADIQRRDEMVERLRSEAGEHPFASRMRDTGRLPWNGLS